MVGILVAIWALLVTRNASKPHYGQTPQADRVLRSARIAAWISVVLWVLSFLLVVIHPGI